MGLSRKRSALHLDVEESASPAADSLFVEPLKRTQTIHELDALDIIPIKQAWPIDVASILASPTIANERDGGVLPLDNSHNYIEGRSTFVFCVQGDCHLHYELLCFMLPELYRLAPSLQASVLCRDPHEHTPSLSIPTSLSMIQSVGQNYNHFVRLGLLHPLGGGQCPLDALVVVDARKRRRLVLPFLWGAGRHVADVGGGKLIQERMMSLLRKCVQRLESEGLEEG